MALQTLRESTQADKIGDRWGVVASGPYPIGIGQQLAPGEYRMLVNPVKVGPRDAKEATRILTLMAAAPELLASLSELVNSPNAKENAAWDRARAVIAAVIARLEK